MAQPKSILKGSGFVLQESTFYEGKYIAVKSIFGEVVLVSNSIESMVGICGLIAPYTEINEGMTDDVAIFAKKYVSYACNTYQALIAKQAEQIKMLRSELSNIYHRGVEYINADDYPDEEDRAALEANFNECLIQSKVILESTKEQA